MSAPGRTWPGIVVGMKAEARVAARVAAADSIRCAGASRARAEQAGRALLEAGAFGLISFGLAGGLDPALAPGRLILADSVILPDGRRVQTDAGWRTRMVRSLGSALTPVVAPLVGSDAPVADAAAKAALHARSGAAAVDMESHGVAQAALAAGRPLLVLRVIADSAGRDIPPAALDGLGPDGELRPLAVLARVMRAPRQLPDVLRVARDARAGLATLGRVVRLLGPGLALG